MTSRIVSVFGATGLQGFYPPAFLCGAVVDALLKDGTFVPRAISRDPDSEASKKLKARGVEVVKGDPPRQNGAPQCSAWQSLSLSSSTQTWRVKANWCRERILSTLRRKLASDSSFGGSLFKLTYPSSLPSIAKISGGKYKNVVHYDEKEAVREYLESSGLTHASLLLPGFLEGLHSRPFMKKTDNGYEIAFPILKPTDLESFVWVSRDVPAAALALLKNYTDPTKQINGKTYPIVNTTISGTKLAELAGKALGAEVTFTTLPPMGLPPMDEMLLAHAEYSGLYTSTPVPNPDLVALGMEFSTVEEFLEIELKAKFRQ
ncbi:hypothetical protein B0H14DRAFT_3123012 [Mycena olivaceomarginata]|nr:hypothetical protein B0H14DRAFT_3123012 [Mycena olivaceomarginata]